jgi:hypothetical protein
LSSLPPRTLLTFDEVNPILEYYDSTFAPLVRKMRTYTEEQFNEKLTLSVEALHDMTHKLLASKKILREEIA